MKLGLLPILVASAGCAYGSHAWDDEELDAQPPACNIRPADVWPPCENMDGGCCDPWDAYESGALPADAAPTLPDLDVGVPDPVGTQPPPYPPPPCYEYVEPCPHPVISDKEP